MGDIRGFLKFSREEPSYRPVSERIQDWNEIYQPTPKDLLKQQSGRCMDCGVPFCQGSTGCPVENLIPNWNDLIHQEMWKEAVIALHSTNNFPEFTGRLCPAPCESACVLGIGDQPVSIRLIEWKMIEHAFEKGWVVPILPVRQTGKKVAVVGSGPAGLAAAQQLARMGHQVTVFEKNEKIGGLLQYGIPDFKLEKWVIDRRLEQMTQEGVVFKTSISIGSDLPLSQLRKEFDAICLTIGAEQPRDLDIPGRNLKGIHFAMDYLIASRKHSLSAKDKRVVVIGGGDTGSDCIGTARRQGCKQIYQFEILPQPPLQRSTNTPWPLWPLKLRSSHAHEEGCLREWSLATTEFVGNHDGRVEKLITRRVAFEGGQYHWMPDPPIEWNADLVILAMGFVGPRKSTLLDESSMSPSTPISASKNGNIWTDAHFMTSSPGIFSAGDARRGASLIVWAIAEGRKMANAVDKYLVTAATHSNLCLT